MTQNIIGGYFLDVKANGGYPLKIRTDYGIHARLFFDGLWSPAGRGLTSWLSFVMSNSELVTFPLISWVRCGT